MNTNANKLGYSADVQMELRVNGFILSIGQLGPDFIILRDSEDHPPADAEIAMWIDGEESRWNVNLPNGIAAGIARTKIA